MDTTSSSGRWDVIVIGSGIGGLTAAAALAREGKRVLVLERHTQLGGLTQSFERDGFRFNVGVHYIGGAGESEGRAGAAKKVLDALTPHGVPMASMGAVYDRVHFPDMTIEFEHPAARLVQALKQRFPAEAAGIDQYFESMQSARKALEAVFAAHSMPQLVARGLMWWKDDDIQRWVGRTLQEVIRDCVNDPKLQAVLAAQWGDHGGRPSEASFALHAVVMSSYLDGAWYPVGGSGSFASAFAETVRSGGGELRTGAAVAAVRVDEGRVQGVTLEDGSAIDAPCVVSDAGVRNTLRLLPSEEVDYDWAQDALQIEPSVGYVGLYIGLEGDIAANGASAANDWIYESWDIDRLWRDPRTESDAPMMFVSFPSLKDPTHDPGPTRRHTCEIVAFVDPDAFKAWEHEGMKRGETRDPAYLELKGRIERNLLAQFGRHYPRLLPAVRFVTSSTPVSLASYTGAEHGAMYGLATTPQRFLSDALRPRTPIGGLFLAGQDACCPGVTGALMGGLMAAVSVEPRLLAMLR
ncbi:MAG TPA: NAD(P)/FAD-dependent oxidoreductase [Burkholderiaceae bacterium]|nr:NAD(P)/FAD-dependent oxidoreductase [Burkholderiaceae bacterium]